MNEKETRFFEKYKKDFEKIETEMKKIDKSRENIEKAHCRIAVLLDEEEREESIEFLKVKYSADKAEWVITLLKIIN